MSGGSWDVAEALHKIEWVNSFDSSYPCDTDALEAVITSKVFTSKVGDCLDDKSILADAVGREEAVPSEDIR